MEEGNGTLPMEADDDVDTKGDIKLIIHSPPVFKKGAIKRLTIRNFLTFGETQPGPSSREAPAPLYFYFEPSINIISGPNGFGKSSIVNAIALCCGSRAKFLRRGNVYGDLVKRGAGIDRAEIELTLHNPDHPKGQTRFARTIYRQSKNERTQNNEFFVNGKLKKFHEYRARLKDEFRIVPENLSLFLLQDRIADLVDLKPFELLKCAEQSLAKEVWEMHNELIERRKSWIDTENQLKEMRDANEPQILKQGETEKAAKKLRERSGRFERMMAVRLKLLIQSIHASESEKVALQHDLATEEQNFEGWKAATDSCYLAFKTIPKSLREKPPQFPPSGNVRTALAYLEQQSRISGDLRGAVEVLQRQMNELSDLTLSDSPEQELTEVREELAREEATLTQRESKESLTQRKGEKDGEMAELKASLESKEEERDKAEEELRKMEEACNGIVRELRKIPGTNHHRRKRLEDLRRDGHLSEDVLKVWEAISTEKDTFENHVYGPLFLYIRPKDKYNDATSIKAMETIFGYKTLRSFLVESQEMCSSMLERFNVREGRMISIAFMRSRIDMPPLDDDTLANYRRYGFSTVLDKMYDAPPLVKQYLQQAFTSQAVLFTKKPPKISSVSMVIDQWKTVSAEKDRLVFCTDQNLYEVVKVMGNEVRIHEQPLKVAHLLKYETANVATQNERLQELNKQLDDKEARRNEYKDYLKELKTKIADLYDEMAVLEDDSQKISSDLEELEEFTRSIATLRNKIHDMSHVDSKPSPVRLQEMAREIREKNRLRLKLLCASENGAQTPLAKLQETTKALQDVFGEVVKKTGLLLHTSRSHARLLKYGLKKIETKSVVDKMIVQSNELEADLNGRRQEARTLTKELFCDRERSFDDVRNIFQQLGSLRTPAALSKELRALHTAIMASATDKVNSSDVQSQTLEQNKKQEEFVRDKQNLEFKLKVSQLSQTALRTQWLSKLQNDIDVINKSFSNMLNEMDYSGSVQLVQPQDPLEYDQYGLKLKVKFREDDEEEELRPNQQSGGQRVVAIAVFLLALQRRSDAPFRIVDEINQGMDASHERQVFQLMINAAQTFAQSGGQMISCSPKIPPDFEAENLRVLNFITLMRTDRTQNAEFYKMDSMVSKAIAAERVRLESLPGNQDEDLDVIWD